MSLAQYRIELGTRSIPIRLVRNSKARRYILRLLPGGTARVTVPRGGSVASAVEFARKNIPWLERQLQRTPPEWTDGTEIYFRGVPQPLRLLTEADGIRAMLAELEAHAPSLAEVRMKVEARLRAAASVELTRRTVELAEQHALEVRAVRVRDQRSRWGSCSTRKTISLNWRLIQTPEFVRDYIIVHELMHLREMNHSAKYWSHVAAAFPRYLEAERWLKRHSRLLR